MLLTLYKNRSDKRVIGKSISKIADYPQAALFSECSILNPVLILSNNTDIIDANYAYIPHFNRYYFVDNITVMDDTRLKISCSVDVLETYKSELVGLECVLKRSETLGNAYLDDKESQSISKTSLQTVAINGSKLTTNFTNSSCCFVLTLAGG